MNVVGNSSTGQHSRFVALRPEPSVGTAAASENQADPTDMVTSSAQQDPILGPLSLGCLASSTDQVKANLDNDDPMRILSLGCLSSDTDQVKSHLDSDDPMRILSLGCLSSETDAVKDSVDGYIVKA